MAKYKTGEEAKHCEMVMDDDEDEEDATGETPYKITSTPGDEGGRNKKRKKRPKGVTPGSGISLTESALGPSADATAQSSQNERLSFVNGGSFSALLSSMCPKNVLALIRAQENAEFRWDEFGFRVEVEDGPEDRSSKILSTPFIEDPQHRLKWIAHLEFSHNHVVEDLTWDRVEPLLPRCDKLEGMVKKGVPHSLRQFVWPRLCGSVLKQRNATFTYAEVVKAAATKEKPSVAKQIEKDLLRTMPNNVCFETLHGIGIPKLRRILRAVAFLYPEIGYCQGTGVIVSCLLLTMEEESAFWMVVCLIEDILPASYFSSSLLGLQADQRVLRQLVTSYLPETDRILREHDIEMGLITLHWFLTLFASVLHIKILVRIWDLFLYQGTTVLFKLTLSLLKMREGELKACAAGENASADIFNLLSRLPGSVEEADVLFEIADRIAPSVTDTLVQSLRKKQVAILMAEQGALVNPDASELTNLPKQHVQRRKLKRSKSLMSSIFQAGQASVDVDDDDPKMKNVRQTEILIDLREAILKIARYFIAVDPEGLKNMSLQADYSAASHGDDHERFLCGRRKGHKRARALLDFQRQEEDELGFRKNDIVTILSQKDEHCWVGELNGLKGWFPAKFVEVLDERGKLYSAVGDDAVTEAVTDLVRGDLCVTLKQVLDHGLKRSSVLGGPCHPWLFIEEVANKEVQRDFNSVYSRLTLCKTFRLDEDGKVLTPEELLFRSVQRINATHDSAKAQMDVKLRSLVCMGLNEQALHMWLELLCCGVGQDAVRRKWYHNWSFIRSPAWVQIKCELRILSQFSFNLNSDFELPKSSPMAQSPTGSGFLGRLKPSSMLRSASLFDRVFSQSGDDAMLDQPLKEGVRDMLVKHHLFSWDIDK